jgi:hypothetical protein
MVNVPIDAPDNTQVILTPVPPPPVIETVGAVVYPELVPAFIAVITPFTTVAVNPE